MNPFAQSTAFDEIDYTPLNRRIPLSERIKSQYGITIPICLGIAIILSIACAIVAVFVPSFAVETITFLVLSVIVCIVIVSVVYAYSARDIRIRSFATANGMEYRATMSTGKRSGIVFDHGYSRGLANVLISGKHGFDEIGTFTYETNESDASTMRSLGYVRIKLPRRLPHMVLDSKSNNYLVGHLSNLPEALTKNQRISLEGDFDRYFTLYAPAEYEVDAFYVFTPDVMQALISAAYRYDCEVINDDFYLFTKSHIAIHKQTVMQEIVAISRVLRQEVVGQSRNYSDERVGNFSENRVAPMGRHLKTRMTARSVIMAAFVIFFICFVTFSIVSSLATH